MTSKVGMFGTCHQKPIAPLIPNNYEYDQVQQVRTGTVTLAIMKMCTRLPTLACAAASTLPNTHSLSPTLPSYRPDSTGLNKNLLEGSRPTFWWNHNPQWCLHDSMCSRILMNEIG